MTAHVTTHTTIVQREGSIGNYSAFRALCSCCGPIGPRYVAAHAAQIIADGHAAAPYQRHQVSYQYRDGHDDGTLFASSMLWDTRDASRAIDLTAEWLRRDADTVSFVITGVKAVL